MNAKVTFNIGGIEITTPAEIPQIISIKGAGRYNMIINDALLKIETDTGIDLLKIDDDIKSKAIVRYFDENNMEIEPHFYVLPDGETEVEYNELICPKCGTKADEMYDEADTQLICSCGNRFLHNIWDR